MKIIAYGSLMNKAEFSGRSHKLVIVKGFMRILNKPFERSVWKTHAKGNEKGVMSIIDEKNSEFNAVMYDITESDFTFLKQRETGYSPIEVDVIDYKTRKDLGSATIFKSRTQDDDIIPVKYYVEICRKGAYSWGKDFGEMFDKTTYLSDGNTTVLEYIKSKAL